jgi:hypothetical protein
MKQQARTHADLDAMLIKQKKAPRGCRVLNVSPQGMMLECEPDGRLLIFRDSDLVDIHLTVQHGGGRKEFAIPAIVNRVDIKSLDVVFQHPNSELLKLIEAYRISDAHMMEASITHSPQEASAKVSALPNTAASAAQVGNENRDGKLLSRRILYPVLATVILSVCIAAGAYLYTSGIDSRLNVLEAITISQTNELTEIRSRVFSSSLQEGRYASLNARLQALTDAFGTLESKLDTVISGKPVAADSIDSGGSETPISISPENPASNNTNITATPSPLITENDAGQDISTNTSRFASAPAVTVASQGQQSGTRETSPQSVISDGPDRTQKQPSNGTGQFGSTSLDSMHGGKTESGNAPGKASGVTTSPDSGPWVINLLSSRNKRDTDKLAGLAATHGVPVVQNRAIVKGKEYWRLQVTGFRNATEAKNYAIPVKKKLGIKDVWVFRRKE